ncbi:UPF0481 protein At3g47200-like [Mangifera indica]|uniref:UPF0481 protein At3g47200-like n=1 Tax=Mangifera indica TaxID=29780 RepID=UPI001CFBA4C2|nr:UPF0481 protein At3g47200-like [Mangifera indica]
MESVSNIGWAKMEEQSGWAKMEEQSEFVIDIVRSLEKLEPPVSNDCCIYRVPHNLREAMNENAYTPHAVSIGPLHHGRKELEIMEKQKLRYLGEFIRHIRFDFDHAVWIIKDMEDSICYAETIPLDSNEFVKMILTDAAFIIIHFVKCKSISNQQDEFLYRNSCLLSSICRDLMLLENQLPLFVLEKLYQYYLYVSQGLDPAAVSSFQELTCNFFEDVFYRNKLIPEHFPENVNHFTDLLRSFHLPSNFSPPSTQRNKLLYSASQLYEAGVTIKARSRECLLGCEFISNNAELQIPPLELNNLTTCLLQNLMALELCHYPGKTYICDYISLMGYLMETSKDVDFLVQKKILDNGLGDSNEVVTFVKKLGTHIAVDRRFNCFTSLFSGLNRHCEDHWLRQTTWQKWLTIIKVMAENTQS